VINVKLVVERESKEVQDKGFLGLGKDKLNQIFLIHIILRDVRKSEFKLLDIYTYFAKDNTRHRYSEMPISVHEDPNMRGPASVTIPELMDGVSWESDYLTSELTNIPHKIVEEIKTTFEEVSLGKLWNEAGQEEIEIELEENCLKVEPPAKST